MNDFIEITIELIENNQQLILCMDIIFINEQVLFTTIDKDIRFCGLLTLANGTKEECYRALDVLMVNNNKPLFTIKLIKCDSNFKSMMDKVINEMGI